MSASGAEAASVRRGTGRGEADGPNGAADWRASLRSAVADGGSLVHLVGVGNRLRQDDAAGLEVASLLRSRLGPAPAGGVRVHPELAMPERLLSELAAGEGRIVVFDAVEASRRAGEVVFCRLADTKYGWFATHNIPLKLIPGLAERGNDVFLVGIQPASLEVGEGLSPEVRASVSRVAATVAEGLDERP